MGLSVSWGPRIPGVFPPRHIAPYSSCEQLHNRRPLGPLPPVHQAFAPLISTPPRPVRTLPPPLSPSLPTHAHTHSHPIAATCPPATGFTVKADVFVDTHKALKCDNVTGVKTAAAKCVADPACHGFTANITAGSKTIRVCYLPGVATDVMLTKGTPVCLYSKKPKK